MGKCKLWCHGWLQSNPPAGPICLKRLCVSPSKRKTYEIMFLNCSVSSCKPCCRADNLDIFDAFNNWNCMMAKHPLVCTCCNWCPTHLHIAQIQSICAHRGIPVEQWCGAFCGPFPTLAMTSSKDDNERAVSLNILNLTTRICFLGTFFDHAVWRTWTSRPTMGWQSLKVCRP